MIPSSKGSPRVPGTTGHPWKSSVPLRQDRLCVILSVCVQSCPSLCDLMDCSPPGSSVHGIFQVGILEQVDISCSRGSSQHRDRTHVSCVSCIGRRILYQLCHLGSPCSKIIKGFKAATAEHETKPRTLLNTWVDCLPTKLVLPWEVSALVFWTSKYISILRKT